MAAGRRAVVSEPSEQGLYPAEHRALRELHAMAQPARLALDAPGRAARRRAGRRAGERRAPPRASCCASSPPARRRTGSRLARGAGRRRPRLAGARNVAGDLVLERNQALRAAVLDVAHVTTLLAYLSALADRRGDAMLAAWHRRWEVRLREAEERVMATVVALAEDPERRDPARLAEHRRPRRALASRTRSARSARRSTAPSSAAPRARPAGARPRAGQPQPHVLERRRRDDLLPPARAEHEDPLGLAHGDQRARRADRGRQRRLAQRPVAVGREPPHRLADVRVAHAALEQHAHDRGLGDVLDAVDVRVPRRTATPGCSPSGPTGRSSSRTRRRARRPRRRGSARAAWR